MGASEKLGKDYNIEVQVLNYQNSKFVADFHCGNSSIDKYFQHFAANDSQAVTYLFIDNDADSLVACVTVACSAIFSQNKPTSKQFSTIVSAMEIKYFAVDDQYKHIVYDNGTNFTLSYYIFVYMIDYLRELSHSNIGASKIVLYSVPEAYTFYKRCKFYEFEDTMAGDKGYYVKDCIPMYFNLNEEAVL